MQNLKEESKNVDFQILAIIFKALGSKTRLAIINFLIANPKSNCMKIVDALPHAQSTISKHLSELKTAKIVTTATVKSVLLYQVDKDFISIIQGFSSNLNYKIIQQNTKESVSQTKKIERKKSTHLKEYNYVFKKKSKNT
jgi:predicted transcriptional regulator